MYCDCFTGMRYRGGRNLTFYRPLDTIPVFARAGAILPLTDKEEAECNGAALPRELELHIFPGADGSFELYEDDGETTAYVSGESTVTNITFAWRGGEASVLRIRQPRDDAGILPEDRRYTVVFAGVKEPEAVLATADGAELPLTKEYDASRCRLTIGLPAKPGAELTVTVPGGLTQTENEVRRRIFERLSAMQTGYEQKEEIYRALLRAETPEDAVCEWQAMSLPPDLMGALLELLFAN